MIYTVRYAHLKELPKYKPGDVIKRGDTVGTMGNSGQSTGPHLHIDCVVGIKTGKYTLEQIEKAGISAPRQLNYFIDDELFGIKKIITTFYCCPDYLRERNKLHLGYDVLPADYRQIDHLDIKWNRSMNGKVIDVLSDPAGYGNHIMIAFEA